MTVLDNDLHGIDAPTPYSSWSLADQTRAGARYWDAVAHEIDNALLDAVGHERWTAYIEKIFRIQQRKYFLPGLDHLNLSPTASHTTRCALYHCLSTALAGSRSRYAVESETKAWIFYLPNTMSVASPPRRRDLQLAAYRGWYVHNGPSLGNDRLTFVVTHLVADGDPLDAGYFEDTGVPTAPDQRLRFELGAPLPPPSARRPAVLDEVTWPEARRLRAMRKLVSGFAWDHVTSAVAELGEVGLEATQRAFGVVINSYRPYYEAALDRHGPPLWAHYYAATHEIGGIPATVDGSIATLGRDPVRGTSSAVTEEVAETIHEAIGGAWATACAEDDIPVAATLAGGGSLSFR